MFKFPKPSFSILISGILLLIITQFTKNYIYYHRSFTVVSIFVALACFFIFLYLLGQTGVRFVRLIRHENKLDSWFYAKSMEKSYTATIQNSVIFSILTGIGGVVLLDLGQRLFNALSSLFL